MVRLPVKSLLRFKSVCKAWQATISDPAFIRAHLRWSASKWEQDPSFIISPHTLDYVVSGESWPSAFSNNICFYQWQQSASNQATFLYAKDFGGEFSRARHFGYCDGLVLAPTDTTLYLFNPATREAITLPDSECNNLRQGGVTCCYCAGLGLDPLTGKYKVVQAFYYSTNPKRNYHMGMEVFTIGGRGWRQIADDPPYPVEKFQTGLSVNGFLFWRFARHHLKQPPGGILHLSLSDEVCGVTALPDSLDRSLDDAFVLDALHGQELCLTARNRETIPVTLTIWTMSIGDAGLNSQWEQRYSIHVSNLFHLMAVPPVSSGMILWKGTSLYRYELPSSKLTTLCEMDRMRYQGRRARKWKNLFAFSTRPYMESLVRITK